MKKLLTASLLLMPALLFAAPVPVPSELKAATVYRDRAMVTRVAQVELAAGETQLSFEKLPAGLVEESIQVSGRGTAGATILDVSARTTFVEATANPRVAGVEADIRAEEKKLRVMNDRAALLEQQRGLINRIESSVTTPPGKESTGASRPSFDEWQKLLTFGEENRGKLAAEQQMLDTQRQELNDKLAALHEQLNQLRGQAGGGRSFKTVIVRLSAASAGTMQLSLSYIVPGASWEPSYDARLRAEERAVALTYFGVVRQSTGEDWKDVALTLSTARPSMGGGAPELQPWFVDVQRPRADDTVMLDAFEVRSDKSRRKSMERQQFNNALAAAPAVAAQGKLEEQAAAVALADVQSAATSASFKIAAPATILSDNSAQKVAIGAATLAAKLQYQSTPRALEAAFLSAYVTNTTDFPLLAGPMNTFLDDTFVAASSLKTVMPGEKLELALGVDEGIALKRKLVNRFSEDTGITGGGRRVTYDFLTTVTNNKKTAERVVFKDLVPISRNEKIVVKLIGPAERDVGTVDKPKEVTREADGKMVWRLDLKPGEKREIQLKFSVEHPGDLAVEGLE